MTTPLLRVVRIKDGVTTVLARSQGGSLINSWTAIDEPGSGTCTYRIEMREQGASTDAGLLAATLTGTKLKR